MIHAVFLASDRVWSEEVEEAPDLLERPGGPYSLRGGPRQPADPSWGPVAVYAPDELTEEEFQDLFDSHRTDTPVLNLKY